MRVEIGDQQLQEFRAKITPKQGDLASVRFFSPAQIAFVFL